MPPVCPHCRSPLFCNSADLAEEDASPEPFTCVDCGRGFEVPDQDDD